MLSALWGDKGEAEGAEGHEDARQSEDSSGGRGAAASAAGDGGWSTQMWSFAQTALTSIQDQAEEVVRTVREVDWAKELSDFQSGAQAEGELLHTHAKDAVQHAPEKARALISNVRRAVPKDLEEAKRRAEEAMKHATAAAPLLAEQGRSAAALSASRLQGAATGLSALSQGLLGRAGGFLDRINQYLDEADADDDDDADLPADSPLRKPAAAAQALSPAEAAAAAELERVVAAIQRDSGTYCDEPEDAEAFAAFLGEFSLEAARSDIDALLRGSRFMAELESRIVPAIVDYDAFWTRYFFRVRCAADEIRARYDEGGSEGGGEPGGDATDACAGESASGGDEGGAVRSGGAGDAAAAAVATLSVADDHGWGQADDGWDGSDDDAGGDAAAPGGDATAQQSKAEEGSAAAAEGPSPPASGAGSPSQGRRWQSDAMDSASGVRDATVSGPSSSGGGWVNVSHGRSKGADAGADADAPAERAENDEDDWGEDVAGAETPPGGECSDEGSDVDEDWGEL
ncbi:unnamed protein product [Pedinophyceae sp. YPF-701]|nr:unnamed protein product [Pedinophyceae sp. YPF-701]